MIELVSSKKDDIAAICRRHHVRALWLFGSAAKGNWDAATSDLDFLVDSGEYEPTVGQRFLDLMVDLERLFGLRIDLITIKQVKTAGFANELNRTRKRLYESERSIMVA